MAKTRKQLEKELRNGTITDRGRAALNRMKGGKGGGDSDKSKPIPEDAPFVSPKAVEGANELIGKGRDFGKELGDRYYSPGSLGRLGTDRSPDELDAIERLKAAADKATTRSGDVSDLLGRRKAGLEGYDAPEMQGMREAMGREITRGGATAAAELRRAQGVARTRGAGAAAQAANLQRSLQQGRTDLEQDLFVKNADEKQRRLAEYENSLRGIEGEEFGRGQATRQDLINQYNYQGGVDQYRNEYNLGQQANEIAGRIGAETGGIGAFTGLVGGLEGQNIARDQFNRSLELERENQRMLRDQLKETNAIQRQYLGIGKEAPVKDPRKRQRAKVSEMRVRETPPAGQARYA